VGRRHAVCGSRVDRRGGHAGVLPLPRCAGFLADARRRPVVHARCCRVRPQASEPWPAVFGYHEIFHSCVVLAAALHLKPGRLRPASRREVLRARLVFRYPVLRSIANEWNVATELSWPNGSRRPRSRCQGHRPRIARRRIRGHLHRSPPDTRAGGSHRLQEDADALGLSLLSGAHLTLVPRWWRAYELKGSKTWSSSWAGSSPSATSRC